VFFAINAPQQGGLIALILLLLAVVSFKELRLWYMEQHQPQKRHKS